MLVILILVVLGFAFLKWYGFFLNQQIKDQQVIVDEQSQVEDTYKSLTGYNKLQAVKLLETQQEEMPRSDHINKVIQMLQDLQKVQSTTTETIILSDFKVSLEKISLKGQVSNLLLLYYSDPSKGIISLLDRFSQLDFIQDIRVQTYDKVGDANYFQFILEANVIADGSTDTE